MTRTRAIHIPLIAAAALVLTACAGEVAIPPDVVPTGALASPDAAHAAWASALAESRAGGPAAPAAFRDRPERTDCGDAVHAATARLLSPDTVACLDAGLTDGVGAEAAVAVPAADGTPEFTFVRTGPEGVELFIDNTRGGGQWRRAACPDTLTTADLRCAPGVPMVPEPSPDPTPSESATPTEAATTDAVETPSEPAPTPSGTPSPEPTPSPSSSTPTPAPSQTPTPTESTGSATPSPTEASPSAS